MACCFPWLFKSAHPSDKIIRLKVGGKRFSTKLSTLTRLRCTTFEEMLARPPDESDTYVIERSGELFHHVLNFLRDGEASLVLLTRPERAKLRQEATDLGLDDLVRSLAVCERLDTLSEDIESVISDVPEAAEVDMEVLENARALARRMMANRKPRNKAISPGLAYTGRSSHGSSSIRSEAPTGNLSQAKPKWMEKQDLGKGASDAPMAAPTLNWLPSMGSVSEVGDQQRSQGRQTFTCDVGYGDIYFTPRACSEPDGPAESQGTGARSA